MPMQKPGSAVLAEKLPVAELEQLDIPEAIIEHLPQDAVLRLAVQGDDDKNNKTVTIYDRWGVEGKCDKRLIKQQIAKRNKNGEQLFFLRKPKNPRPRLTESCPVCKKTIYEPTREVPLEGNELWRKQSMLFTHVYAKHPSMVPIIFEDEKLLDRLTKFAGR
jgi:hypothetical protein